MTVFEFLNKAGVKYEVLEHKPVFTAQRMAAVEHESGKFVAKPVIVKADDKFVMCVLAASCKIDLQSLKKQLGAKKAQLAAEDEMPQIFNDCEIGAEPPFGNLYDLQTIMDKALQADDHILFQAGSHNKAVRMAMTDYLKIVKPKVMEFTYQST